MTILERSAQLDALQHRWQHATLGQGQVVFIAAEAGGGKSSLVEAFASTIGHTTVVHCDGLKMPGPFGSLADVASALGPDVEAALTQLDSRNHVFQAILTALRHAPHPTALVVEDAHWSDQATLELIRFLGRRIHALRVLFIVTYREDSLDSYHPLRAVLGDLATDGACTRLSLPPLSLDAVAALTTGTGIDPEALLQRTNGNPFYVTESIAASSTVPDSIRDAVLGRAAATSPEARAVLDCAATLGVSFDPDLLEAVIGAPILDHLEECLTAGLFRPQEDNIAFRHGLTRDVFLTSMSVPRRRSLHRRILHILETNPAYAADLAHLAHHAEEANDPASVLRYAVAAAEQAVALGAHREAAAQYARALRFGHGLPPSDRARLLEARSYECYLTGDNTNAIESCTLAIDLRRAEGDQLKAGENLRRLSRYYWFAARNAESDLYANAAIDLLETLPPSAELAMAYSNLSQMNTLAYNLDHAIRMGNRAIELAAEVNAPPTIDIHARINVGTAMWVRSDPAGRRLLEDSMAIARAHHLEDDLARCYTNLAWVAIDHHEPELAILHIEEGITFTAEHDLLPMHLYLRAIRARVDLGLGHWERAATEATAIVEHPNSTNITLIPSLTILARIAIRRGHDAAALLDRAQAVAAPTGQLMREGPITASRAEAAWLADAAADILPALQTDFERAARSGDPWLAGDLALWLHRLGQPIPESVHLAEPFALEIAGQGTKAAAIWNQRGFPLEEARALASTGQEDALRTALAICERLGARPDAARIVRALRQLGASAIPRGPRPQTQANPAQLTARELEVLGFMLQGMSNPEIAGELYLSPRTVGHHVSAILGKLNISSRAEAAHRVAELGLFPQ